MLLFQDIVAVLYEPYGICAYNALPGWFSAPMTRRHLFHIFPLPHHPQNIFLLFNVQFIDLRHTFTAFHRKLYRLFVSFLKSFSSTARPQRCHF